MTSKVYPREKENPESSGCDMSRNSHIEMFAEVVPLLFRPAATLKNRLRDYPVIITSSATNQQRELSIITYAIILN